MPEVLAGIAADEDPLDEAALLQRVGRGDRAAFEQLYFRYHRRLFRFLVRFADRYGLVDEIINDTMFVVWRKAADFRGQSSVSTWIIGIAYRRALKTLKRLDVAQRLESDAASGDSMQSNDGELGDWLAHGLARLPFEQRAALELAYHFGYSCEEIAEITACPVNTVKTRLFNARRRLRELLPALADAAASDPG